MRCPRDSDDAFEGRDGHTGLGRPIPAQWRHHEETTAMAYKLYNAPQSTCSQRVRFVLNAKGLPFAEEKLDLLAGDQLKPEYLAINPNGVVPTLNYDGNIVIDSSVIIEYLDEVELGISNFTPRDPAK